MDGQDKMRNLFDDLDAVGWVGLTLDLCRAVDALRHELNLEKAAA
jgi:hypothetical protein